MRSFVIDVGSFIESTTGMVVVADVTLEVRTSSSMMVIVVSTLRLLLKSVMMVMTTLTTTAKGPLIVTHLVKIGRYQRDCREFESGIFMHEVVLRELCTGTLVE